MLTFGLHPFGWNRPELCIEIDLCPPSAGGFRRARKGQKLPLNKTRVETDRLDIIKERISFGNSSGRRVGMFCFFGFSNAIPIPDAGLASIKPVLTA